MGNFIAQHKLPCNVVIQQRLTLHVLLFLLILRELPEDDTSELFIHISEIFKAFSIKIPQVPSGMEERQKTERECWLHYKQNEQFPTPKLALFTYETGRHDINNNNNTDKKGVKFFSLTKNINNERKNQRTNPFNICVIYIEHEKYVRNEQKKKWLRTTWNSIWGNRKNET